VVLTGEFFLIFEPQPVFGKGIAKLISWASVLSIARIRRQMKHQNFVSIIFKSQEERQPWVCNLQVPEY
jgi:hypothetical protein